MLPLSTYHPEIKQTKAKNFRLVYDGIDHISREQEIGGDFLSFSSTHPDNFSDDVGALPYSTTFFTSVILSCLATAERNIPSWDISHDESQGFARDVRERAAHFLLAEKSPHWSFNYWAHDAKERETMPYPDDLDDTFVALAALYTHNPALIDGAAIAGALKILTAVEVAEGGPYRTWLVRDGSEVAEVWRDVDLVVNSNVAYFLSLLDVRLPNLGRMVDEALREQPGESLDDRLLRLASPYYPSPIHVLYFISRWYRGAEVPRAVELLFEEYSRRGEERINILERAMIISSLINFGAVEKDDVGADAAGSEKIAGMVHGLAVTVEREGWRPYAFCIDPSRDGKKYYAGSSALTAAFVVEALAKYSAAMDARETVRVKTGMSVLEPSATHERIRELAREECADIGAELRDAALGVIAKTTDAKITALPYEFAATLEKSLASKRQPVTLEIIERLALANLYGWMAYTIYDDIIDGDGCAAMLPCANLFSRRLTEIYADLGREIPGVRELFEATMNTLDSANAWELAHCRIPAETNFRDATFSAAMEYIEAARRMPDFADHSYLADRSLGHALGPLTELLAAGYATDSPESRATESFLRHYLIARQLHDDAHDWADDLARGQLSSVAALALGDLPEFPAELPRLRSSFWHTTIDGVIAAICEHISVARRERERSTLLRGSSFMEGALGRLEASARKTLAERDEIVKFLDHYI